MKRYSQHLGQFAAAALLGVTLWALWSVLVAPVISFAREGWQDHYRSTAQLAELKSLINQRQDLATAIQALDQDPGWSRLYRAPSAAAASAMAQGDIQSVAQSMGLVVASIQPLAERQFGPLSNVGVRISFAAPIDTLAMLASRLSTSPRVLLIEEFTVIAPQMHGTESNPTLNVQADIYGIWWRS